MNRNRNIRIAVEIALGGVAIAAALWLVPRLDRSLAGALASQSSHCEHRASPLDRLKWWYSERTGWEHTCGDDRTSALISDLQQIRGELERYERDHGGRRPDVDGAGRPDPANLVRRLTERTDERGDLDPTGHFGPYLQPFPPNSFLAEHSTMVVIGADEDPPGDGGGWYFSTTTGKFFANDPDHPDL